MWNGTMFVDLDWPLNASSLLSASAELLVFIRLSIDPICEVLAWDGSHLIRMKPTDHVLQVAHMFFIKIYMFLKFDSESGKKLTNS